MYTNLTSKNYCFFLLDPSQCNGFTRGYNKLIIYPVPLDKVKVFSNLLLNNRFTIASIEYDLSKFNLTSFSLASFYTYFKYIDFSRLFLKINLHNADSTKEYYLNINNYEFIELLNSTTVQNNNILVNETTIFFNTKNYKDYSLIFN